MGEQIKVGYYIARKVQAQLRALAERDHRSLSGQIAWLIEQEWRRTVGRTTGVPAPDDGDQE